MTAPLDPTAAAMFAEISTKLDVLISQHGTVAGQVADHEQRIRAVETRLVTVEGRVTDLVTRDADQEDRLRKADRWRYAMPTAAVGGVGALLAGAAALITALGN